MNKAFVAHVFVNLQITPDGLQDEYPIGYTELKAENNGTAAANPPF